MQPNVFSRPSLNRRSITRFMRRYLYVLFVVLVMLPPELPLLLPAPALAAPLDKSVAANGQVDRAENGVTDVASSDTENPIKATNTTPTTPAKSGDDWSSAFTERVDLGNGEAGALISADPVRYLAADGEWKAIDPRFTQAVDGFANLTNVMTVQTGARQAVLQVHHRGLDARWTPHALLLADGTREVVLAKPRPTQGVEGVLSADGRTVSYAGSWTMLGMDDEVVSGAGEAEHNVLFAQPPALNGEMPSADARLVLVARLELPPGAQLWAEGMQQNSAG